MTEFAITTQGLAKRYSDTIAVAGLDLHIPSGTISCLLGPNGSGKTTTVAMLTTLRRPTSGTAEVCGHDVVRNAASVRSVVGVTLQHTGVDDLMTGREMLELQGALQGMPSPDAAQRTSELAELLGLVNCIDDRIGTWSGGQRRKVDLAAALVHHPKVLFLDEPTTGLDPASRRAMWSEIRRLNAEDGVTVFLTTQYLEEADHLADTISILRDGRLVATASPSELKQGLGERTVTLGLNDAGSAERAWSLLGGERACDPTGDETLRIGTDRGEAPALIAQLAREGIEVASMSVSEPSLEDVFLQLTTA